MTYEEWECLSPSNERIGPVTTAQLAEMYGQGRVGDATLVRLRPANWTHLYRAVHDSFVFRDGVRQRSFAAPGGVGEAVRPPSATFYWSYVDAAGHEQGPFPTSQMVEWFTLQQLPMNVDVRLWSHGWIPLHLCRDAWVAAAAGTVGPDQEPTEPTTPRETAQEEEEEQEEIDWIVTY